MWSLGESATRSWLKISPRVPHILTNLSRQTHRVKKAEADGNWGLCVRLYERAYRFDALLSATKKGLTKKPSKFWPFVGEVWQDAENIHQRLSK
jgi:hypothetical protein